MSSKCQEHLEFTETHFPTKLHTKIIHYITPISD